jgi:hypothetical protein
MRWDHFEKNQIWIDSMDLIDESYKITNDISTPEKFGLIK